MMRQHRKLDCIQDIKCLMVWKMLTHKVPPTLNSQPQGLSTPPKEDSY